MKGTTSSNAGTLRAVALSVAVFGCVSAAAAQEQQKLFIEGDIVRGNTPSGNTGPVCVLANEFKRKENVIFRIRVRNAMGQALDDKGLKSLIVELSDGKKIPAEYRARPPVAVRARLGLTGPIDYCVCLADPGGLPDRIAHLPRGRDRHAGQHAKLGADEGSEVAAGGDGGRG
jgi:hypothetical protein